MRKGLSGFSLESLFDRMQPLLFKLPSEAAHRLSLAFLKTGLISGAPYSNPVLKTTVWDVEFENPVGLAAGADKNGEVIPATAALGFGFTEVGTVTPRPQKGNAKPRLFRDQSSAAVINAMGFPNKGLERFCGHLVKSNWPDNFRVGANVGKNKETLEAGTDYALGVRTLAPYADFLVVNISSPNTAGLRDLQKRESLLPLLQQVLGARDASGCKTPLLVKIAPDLDAGQREEIAATVMEAGVDGLVVSNTTLERPASLPRDFAAHRGGLSGRPLTEMACAVLADIYKMTGGKLPLVGVGGISSGQDAFRRICAGASLVEVYTALVFQGPLLAQRICEELVMLLKERGFSSVAEAVGSDVKL